MPTAYNGTPAAPAPKKQNVFVAWLKRNFSTITMIIKWIWFVCLLTVGITYLKFNFARIINLPTAIDFIVIAAVFILAFFPLISEMGIMGISVKKDIKSAKEEIKGELLQINNQIVELRVSNVANSSAAVYMGAALPSQEMMETMSERMAPTEETLFKNEDQKKAAQDKDVPNSNIALFKARYILEEKIKQVCDLYCVPLSSFPSLATMIAALRSANLLHPFSIQTLKSIGNICNRGIHGEVVSEKYISFVNDNLAPLLAEMDDIIKNVQTSPKHYMTCSRCGFQGYSQYANVCPVCENTTDDD